MKLLNKILPLVTLLIFLGACEQKPKGEEHSDVPQKEMAKNISHLQVDISGMTCEIGCARLIQSKLYKAEGIEFAKVSFEDSLGIMTYDANRISVEDIRAVIEGAGGGDLYRVKEVHQLEALPSLE